MRSLFWALIVLVCLQIPAQAQSVRLKTTEVTVRKERGGILEKSKNTESLSGRTFEKKVQRKTKEPVVSRTFHRPSLGRKYYWAKKVRR